eukprot:362414-Chlamydomonas_euryale.AAC.1
MHKPYPPSLRPLRNPARNVQPPAPSCAPQLAMKSFGGGGGGGNRRPMPGRGSGGRGSFSHHW